MQFSTLVCELRLLLWSYTLPQLLHFLRIQQPVSPSRQALHRQAPQPNPHQFLHGMHFLHQHTPQLFFPRIPHPHFIPEIRRPPARRVRLPHCFHLQPGFFSNPVQIRQRQHPLYLDVIHLLDLRPVLQNLRRQIAVIRQKHQPRRRILQIPHWKHSLRQSSQAIPQSLPPLGISHRRNYLWRLVQRQVYVSLRVRSDRSSRRFDLVCRRIGLGPKFPHYHAVHAHLSAQDQLLRVPPRSNPRTPNNLLQSFLHDLFLPLPCGVRSRRSCPRRVGFSRVFYDSPRPLRFLILFACRGGFNDWRRRVLVQLSGRHALRRRKSLMFAKCFGLRKLLFDVCDGFRRVAVRVIACSRRLLACHGGPLFARHFRNAFVAAQRFSRERFKLFQARQLFQIAQPEPHQKFLRRLIKYRAPNHFLASRRRNQPLVQERADHPRGIHSANLRNLR